MVTVTLATVQGKDHSFLFVRAWMQWYGGLGIAVLAVTVMAQHNLPASGWSHRGVPNLEER